MIVYAFIIAIAIPCVAALYLFGEITLAAWRAGYDRRNGWQCGCGERYASRTAGPAPLHRLHHPSMQHHRRNR